MKTLLLMLAMLIGQEPVTSYDARYAQQVNTIGQMKLDTDAKNMSIAPDANLPAGLTLSISGQSLYINLDATNVAPGIYDAEFVVNGQYKPIDNWRGPWVDGTDSMSVQWIIFDPGLADFFVGSPSLGDQLVSPL